MTKCVEMSSGKIKQQKTKFPQMPDINACVCYSVAMNTVIQKNWFPTMIRLDIVIVELISHMTNPWF